MVAIYGNFVNRALQLTKKYWGGVVPDCGELQEVDEKAIAEFKDVKEKVEQYLNVFKFREAQKEAMNLALSVTDTSQSVSLGRFGRPILSVWRPS